MIKVALGQDSHRFCAEPYPPERMLKLGGVSLPDAPPLDGNSDADVVLHALVNALSGLSGILVLGDRADRMVAAGVTDSRAYVKDALKDVHGTIHHVSFSIEAQRPHLKAHLPAICASVAELLNLPPSAVMATATSGEGLTAVGRGEGIAVFCVVTADMTNI